MRKTVSYFVILVMAISLIGGYSLPAEAETRNVIMINDFEGNIPFTGNDANSPNPNLTVSADTVHPLIGDSSMHIDIGADNSYCYVYDNLSVFPSPGTKDGILFRFKSGSQGVGALLNLVIDNPDGQFHFMNNVSLFDSEYNEIEIASINNDWGAIEIPEGFDGYIFMPFSGAKQGSFDKFKTVYSISIGFIGHWWNNSTSYVDNLCFAKIDDLLPRIKKTSVFASGTGTFRCNDNTVTLAGNSGIIEVNISTVAAWIQIYDNTSSYQSAAGYDGFMFRLTSGAIGNDALLNMFISDSAGNQYHFMTDVEFYDVNMEYLCDAGYHDGWSAIELPENFDGYVFMPFSGVKQTGFNVGKTITSLSFGFIGGNWWNSTTSYISDICFAEFIEDGADGPMSISGVEDGALYVNGCRINIENAKGYLNSELYTSGKTINKPGNYTLNVIDKNDANNTETYDFSVVSFNLGYAATDTVVKVPSGITVGEFKERVFASSAVRYNVYDSGANVVADNALLTEEMSFLAMSGIHTFCNVGIRFDETANDWLSEGEQSRTPLVPNTYENDNVSNIKTVPQLWQDKNQAVFEDDLEETILTQWENNGIFYKTFYFTSRKSNDGDARIYGIYGAPANETNAPGILHIHGGGQTASEAWVGYWANQGYAAMSIDWGGVWSSSANTKAAKYPASMSYCNQETANHNSDNGSSESNCWFDWTYTCRRALTFLGAQSECNATRMGIFGISMGGTLTWMVAGTDMRVKAAAPIYGVGYEYDYRNYDVYADDSRNPGNYAPADTVKRYLTGVTSEACAQYITAPVLYVSATNDFHGNMDWAQKTFDILPASTVRRQTYAPSFQHHIYYEQENNIPMWMAAFLKDDDSKVFPLNPQITVEKAANGKPSVKVTADSTKQIERVDIYYGLENNNAFNRYWQLASITGASGNVYTAEVDVLDTSKYLFAFATVIYSDGYHIASSMEAIKPASIGCTATAQKTLVVYSAGEGITGWATQSIGTDPIPGVPVSVVSGQSAQGVSPAHDTYELVTYRLNDPRFFAPNNDAKLKVTFNIASGSRSIGVQLRETSYNNRMYDSIYQKTISPSDNTVIFSLSDMTPYESGTTKPTSWSQVPVIQIKYFAPHTGATDISIERIEWVTGSERLKGDVNGDGIVDESDIICIKEHLLKPEFLTGDDFNTADMDKDGKLDILDLLMLKIQLIPMPLT